MREIRSSFGVVPSISRSPWCVIFLITERIYGEIGNNINIYCVIASSQDAAVSPRPLFGFIIADQR